MRYSIPSLLAQRPRSGGRRWREKTTTLPEEGEREGSNERLMVVRTLLPLDCCLFSCTRLDRPMFKRESSTEPVMWETGCIYGRIVGRGETERVDVDKDERWRGNGRVLPLVVTCQEENRVRAERVARKRSGNDGESTTRKEPTDTAAGSPAFQTDSISAMTLSRPGDLTDLFRGFSPLFMLLRWQDSLVHIWLTRAFVVYLNTLRTINKQR